MCGYEILRLSGHKNRTTDAAFAPNGEFIATVSRDKTCKVWKTQTEECLYTLKGHSKPLLAVAVSPNSRILATGGDDCVINLWEGTSILR